MMCHQIPPSTIYNLIIGTNTNSGFKFLCAGDSKFEGILNSDNINITSNGNYKINDVIIPQSILDNSGLQLNNGVLSLNFSNANSQSTLQSSDLFIFQRSGFSKKITRDELKTDLDTIYTEGPNIEISNTNVITTESVLVDINKIGSEIGENFIINAGESISQSIIFKINNNIRATLSYNSLNLTNGNKYKINDLQIDSNDILYLNTGTQLLKTKIDSKQDTITDSTNLTMNNCEVESNLTLIVKTSNNIDLNNSIVFQNTGSFYTIALTRRYDTNVTNNRANFCIQTGGSGTIDGLPVRMCIRYNGKVNIGPSQTKSTFFNVQGDSNFLSSEASILSSIDGMSGVLAKIQVDKEPNNMLFYNNHENNIVLRTDRINTVRLSLKDVYNNVLDLNGKHWSITLKFSFINIYDQVGSSQSQGGPDYLRPTIEESIGQNNLEYMKRQAQIVQNSDYSNLLRNELPEEI